MPFQKKLEVHFGILMNQTLWHKNRYKPSSVETMVDLDPKRFLIYCI